MIPLLAVAVVPGRTRTLVERFERRERFSSNDDQATGIIGPVIPEDQASSISSPAIPEDQATSICSPMTHEMEKTFTVQVSSIHKHCFSKLHFPTVVASRTFEVFSFQLV